LLAGKPLLGVIFARSRHHDAEAGRLGKTQGADDDGKVRPGEFVAGGW
jgi:hypothetical protein